MHVIEGKPRMRLVVEAVQRSQMQSGLALTVGSDVCFLAPTPRALKQSAIRVVPPDKTVVDSCFMVSRVWISCRNV